jgi:hypothetical protein
VAFGLKEIAKADPAIGGEPRTMDRHDGLRHQFPSHEGIDASYRLPLAFLVANGLMETGIEAGSGLAIFAARFMWLPSVLKFSRRLGSSRVAVIGLQCQTTGSGKPRWPMKEYIIRLGTRRGEHVRFSGPRGRLALAKIERKRESVKYQPSANVGLGCCVSLIRTYGRFNWALAASCQLAREDRSNLHRPD